MCWLHGFLESRGQQSQGEMTQRWNAGSRKLLLLLEERVSNAENWLCRWVRVGELSLQISTYQKSHLLAGGAIGQC